MAKAVDFYYAIGSRYSYLAASQIDALEKDTGCDVRWNPLDSHTLMRLRAQDLRINELHRVIQALRTICHACHPS